jgi:glycopeptide antibiotics resistance protein
VSVPETIASPVRLEFLVNAVIIAPAPLLGSILLPSYTWRDWIAVGFAGALVVEILQAVLLSGRDGSFVDVVANTLGALLGAVLAGLVRRSRCSFVT